MDDQRQTGDATGFDVHAEAVALPRHVGDAAAVQTEVIQTGLTDRDHARVLCQGQQIGHIRLADAFVVGVDAGGGPKVVVSQGQRVDLVKLFQRGANAKCPINLRGTHVSADVGDAREQVGKGQVAVGINKHQAINMKKIKWFASAWWTARPCPRYLQF